MQQANAHVIDRVEDRLARLSTGTIFNVPSIAGACLDLLLTQ